MTNTSHNDPSNDSRVPSPDDGAGIDVLIGRIIDGEASSAQRERFETMAADDPALWRVLALKQQDMAMLTAHVEPRLNAAENVELPEVPVEMLETAETFSFRKAGLPWWMSLSGWAAMIALAVAWGYSASQHNTSENTNSTVQAVQTLSSGISPDEHLREYMKAPYVLNEMPPVLLNNEPLPDGRIAVSFLRRIVEVRYVDSPEDIPLSDNGDEMISVPTKLSKEPPPALTSQD